MCSADFILFFFHGPATTEIYTLSLHDALPISIMWRCSATPRAWVTLSPPISTRTRCSSWCPPPSSTEAQSHERLRLSPHARRSEEHTSELQSQSNLVCRLLLEKKKQKVHDRHT